MHRPAGRQELSRHRLGSAWLSHTPAYRRVSSQGAQDGALEYIFHHVGTTDKFYVEFGFDSDDNVGGGGSNTYHLRASYGWTGLLMDGSHANVSINLHQELITPGNVVDLLRKHDVPLEPDYVSIDLDTTDLWMRLMDVLRALLSSPVRPRVLSVEYNCVYGSDPVAATFPNDPGLPWLGDNLQGASPAAIEMVAREFGWSLATIVPELDAFLVRDDLLAGVAKPHLEDFQDRAACLTLHHAAPTAEHAARLLDYATWRGTGDEAAARAALPQQLALYGIEFNYPGGHMRPVRGLVLQPGSPISQ